MGIVSAIKWGSQFHKEDVFRPHSFNPGLMSPDKEKTKRLRPGFYNPLRAFITNTDTSGYLIATLNDGDIQPAVVVSEDPLLVACYTEDMDAVYMECLPVELGKVKGWGIGTRLITTARNNAKGVYKNKDIFPGPNADKSVKNTGAYIAELYTDEPEYIERKTSEIPEEYWSKTTELGMKYLEEHPGIARNGLGDVFKDSKKIEKLKFNPNSRFE